MMSSLLRQRTTAPRFRLPLTAEQAEKALAIAYEAEVKSRHRGYVPNKDTQANIRKVAEFLTASERSEFGMLLCGTCGNGKTTTVLALQSVIGHLNAAGLFEAGGRNYLQIIDAKDVARAAKDFEGFRNVCNEKLLAIEDIGREPTEVVDYGNIVMPINDLIEHRYNRQLFTVITTNLTPSQIGEKYGVRIADRCSEMLHIVVFGGDSYRKIEK